MVAIFADLTDGQDIFAAIEALDLDRLGRDLNQTSIFDAIIRTPFRSRYAGIVERLDAFWRQRFVGTHPATLDPELLTVSTHQLGVPDGGLENFNDDLQIFSPVVPTPKAPTGEPVRG